MGRLRSTDWETALALTQSPERLGISWRYAPFRRRPSTAVAGAALTALLAFGFPLYQPPGGPQLLPTKRDRR